MEIPGSSSQKPAQKKRNKQTKQQKQQQQQHELQDQEKHKRTGKATAQKQTFNPMSRPPKAFPFFHQETEDNAYADDPNQAATGDGEQVHTAALC